MTGFEVYKNYIALKTHFNSPKYDFFKHNKKSKSSFRSYEKRKDKYFFEKLSKEKDYFNIILFNLIEDKSLWIGNLNKNETSTTIYFKHKKIIESLEYIFRNELNKIENIWIELEIKKDQHPILLKRFILNEISLQTLVILSEEIPFLNYWKSKNDVLISELSNTIVKYSKFLKYDKRKFKKIIREKLKNE